ncbi:RagB/SusD family nutrient uptake outer membrane protein [Bacteroidota bacterium]
MKHIKNISIIILTILFTVACDSDFLEPVPTAAVTSAGFYKNEAELEAAVINMYDGIQGVNSLAITTTTLNHAVQVEFYLTEMRSDNTKTKSSEGEAAQFESFAVEATNGIIDDYYRSYYNIIFRANVVLENLSAAGNSADAFEGEAKFVRAYAYFNLVRLFGDIPLVDKVISPDDQTTAFTRVATNTVYDLIISDLTTAISNLDNSYKNRASKAAAQGLLAKVYLTRGEYALAKGLCEDVIGSSFSLEANFSDVFYSEGNSEVIFAIGYTDDSTNDSQNFSAEWLNSIGRTSGVNYVTDEAKAALDALGGTRTAVSYRVDAEQPTHNQVAKYLPSSGDQRFAGNDWIVLRLADVLLMHVEATLAGGASTTDAGALTSFQKVRNRAGLTTVVTEVTKQELLDERRVELAFENQRLFDLIRFGVAQDVLSAFSTANSYNYSATDLLLPFPQREINLSKGLLTQNPQ